MTALYSKRARWICSTRRRLSTSSENFSEQTCWIRLWRLGPRRLRPTKPSLGRGIRRQDRTSVIIILLILVFIRVFGTRLLISSVPDRLISSDTALGQWSANILCPSIKFRGSAVEISTLWGTRDIETFRSSESGDVTPARHTRTIYRGASISALRLHSTTDGRESGSCSCSLRGGC